MSRHSSSAAGFTLVEVIIVAVVVAVLAAISFPIYTRSLQTTRSVACVSNLRQLGSALSSYLADNNMTMPTLQSARNSTADDVPVIDNTLNRYAPNPKVFACPGDDQNLAATTGTSYYWNSVLNGQPATNVCFFDLNERPKIPVLLDKGPFHPASATLVNLLYADGHVTKL